MKNRLPASKSPALTAQRVEALKTVNLQLLGVDHGTYEPDGRPTPVQGITDNHYGVVEHAVKKLLRRGGAGALAIEPTGFVLDRAEYHTLEDLVSFNVPKGVSRDIPRNIRLDVGGVFRDARETFRINNFVYGAALALLHETPIPVYRAEASRADYKEVVDRLPYLTPDEDARTEMGLYYRHNEMLACLGDIAIDMVESQPAEIAKGEEPDLLFLHCPQHTLPVAGLLQQSNVRFQIYPVDSI